MGKEYWIKPTNIETTSSLINPSKIDGTEKVSFNFRRLYSKGKKFCYDKCETKYFKTLIERLKNLSSMNKKEIITQNSNGLRCHKVNFNDSGVSESSFGILGEDIYDDAWQFQLTSNKHGRVHGYFVGNVFYIVWLDPKHELYPK